MVIQKFDILKFEANGHHGVPPRLNHLPSNHVQALSIPVICLETRRIS
jgi:hypothetical protein